MRIEGTALTSHACMLSRLAVIAECGLVAMMTSTSHDITVVVAVNFLQMLVLHGVVVAMVTTSTAAA